ncbi:MAG: DUF542 domain-containing protein [Deltaproteobacteria bacterium]|nr:DUF542 domain-containing protein [Deltaproteobacteria bacterium]
MGSEQHAGTALTEAAVLQALEQIVDPELGINIVDLGLVYGVKVSDGRVEVEMTLTVPGCPMHEALTAGVERVLRALPGVREVAVKIVWDPPWSPDMMSLRARRQLSPPRPRSGVPTPAPPRVTGAETVKDVVERYPQTASVFSQHGIDTCCGGALPIAQATAAHGINLEGLLRALNAAIAAGPVRPGSGE